MLVDHQANLRSLRFAHCTLVAQREAMIFEEAPTANESYNAMRVSVCRIVRQMSNDLEMNSPPW